METVRRRVRRLDGVPSKRHHQRVARQKTTIYLEPDLLRAAKTLAASSGRREYEVIEDALRAYMRSEEAAAGRRELRQMLDRWAGSGDALDEDEALDVATQEAHAYRHEKRSRQ
jgi:predicted transcriptional regulator